MLITEAAKRLGTGYSLIGDTQVTIVHATITHSSQGQAQMLVLATETLVYQITPDIQQHLIHLIAGKPKQQAEALLLQFPGIAGAQITVKGGYQTLPEDPRNIRIFLVYRGI